MFALGFGCGGSEAALKLGCQSGFIGTDALLWVEYSFESSQFRLWRSQPFQREAITWFND